MQNDTYLYTGKYFFAIAIIGIGIIHLITGNFPSALLPVPVTFPLRTLLTYVSGVLLVLGGTLMMTHKFTYVGAMIAGAVLVIMFVFLHLPKPILHPYDPASWTAGFEIAALLGGAMIIAGSTAKNLYFAKDKGVTRYKLLIAGRYLFAIALIIFGVQHFMYAAFIKDFIPSWVPARLFWAYFVGVAFFAVALSIVINIKTPMATTLLALMFFIWLWVLHLPRTVANVHAETEWTSLCVALGMSGISLVIAGTVRKQLVTTSTPTLQ